MTPSEFRELVSAYCSKFQASETSGLRTIARNKLVGGHPNSRHLIGMAVDVVYDPPIPPADVRRYTAKQLGLTLVIEDDHDHLQA